MKDCKIEWGQPQKTDGTIVHEATPWHPATRLIDRWVAAGKLERTGPFSGVIERSERDQFIRELLAVADPSA